MKKLFKKLLAIFMAVIMLLCSLPFSASAATYSGKCGENLNWRVSTSAGVLEITGTGAMFDYKVWPASDQPPWRQYADYITYVKIANGATIIDNEAFYACDKFTHISIPASVTSIGSVDFNATSSLKYIMVDENNKNYSSDVSGVLFNKNKTKLIQYPVANTAKNYSIPDSVTTIEILAFSGASNLTSVIIPDNVTTIGDSAFEGCFNITNIELPEKLTAIKHMAFRYCGFKSIYIPDSVKTIENYAFEGSQIETAIIGDGVISIGEFAFSLCHNLKYLHISPETTYIGKDLLYRSSGYICSTTEDCYAKTYADANGIEFKKCNGHDIAVFSTSKSFTVKTGDKMGLAFGFLKGDELDGEWKKMAITVSDPTVVSLSDYKKTDYGYALDVVGKKEGVANLTITDTETGVNTVITVTVSDKYTKTYSYAVDNMPSFYPNNKYENNIQTNIYNLNGLYVNNYSYTKVGDKYKVSFNAYNALYHQAAVDIYDADGNWFSSKKIDKYTEMTSVFDTGEQVFYLFANLEWASYIHPMYTKLTEIEFEIPDGGYFTISNNFAESPGCFFYNTFDILLQGVSAMIDAVTDNVERPIHDFFMDKITEDKTTREQFMELFIRSVDKEVRQYTSNIVDGMVETSYAGLSGLLENMFVSLELDWKHLLSSATGITISALGKITGPLGLAFEACYVIPEGTNKLLQGLDIGWSVDEPYMCVYTDVGSGYLNPHGVYVDTNGNTDAETVLQVFRISNDDSVKVVLNSDNPLEMHELYNISFVKNDKNVQPNGKVKVHVPIPEGMDSSTSKIYRQESDGSWTVLNAKVEGNYLVFETDHFSLYAIVGNKAELKIASMPENLTYSIGENIDLTGLSLKLNGEIITSGFYCDPAVAYEVGTQVITVNYGGVSAEFEITVTAEKPVIVSPSTTTINYGETLILMMEDVILPTGYAIEWIVDGSGFSQAVSEDGTECRLTSNANGTATVTAKIVDENGEAIVDAEGNEISDSITLTSKAGFFQKLISFFKNLFRINRIIH